MAAGPGNGFSRLAPLTQTLSGIPTTLAIPSTQLGAIIGTAGDMAPERG
jgi:hypothetical protein